MLVLIGIILVSLNLRVAVSSVSPIIAEISADIPLDGVAVGALGMLPPIGFAVGGLCAPAMSRRWGIELATLFAALLLAAALTARTFAPDLTGLFGSTAIALVGAGIGNVLMPPAIKTFFPDRVGSVTGAYVATISVSAALPAALSSPIALTSHWRIAFAIWAIVAVCGVVPWIFIAHRNRHAVEQPSTGAAVRFRSIIHSRVAWALMIAHGTSSLHSYTVFAWLPVVLVDLSGATPIEAGVHLALYALIGLPAAVIAPALMTRIARQDLVFYACSACYLIGYGGLLLVPSGPVLLWVIAFGTGSMLFTCVQTLIPLRTRDPRITTRVSGFSQGFGYVIAAAGPLLFGGLHEATNGWTVPLLFLIVTSAGGIVSGALLRRRDLVDDELGTRGGNGGQDAAPSSTAQRRPDRRGGQAT